MWFSFYLFALLDCLGKYIYLRCGDSDVNDLEPWLFDRNLRHYGCSSEYEMFVGLLRCPNCDFHVVQLS